MIGNGWIRAPLARWPIYPLAAAGLVATQVFLVGPAMSAQQANPDARIGTRVSVNCGGGVFATNRRLPAGFNALTATRAQLIANDLPVRPAGPVRLAAWRKFVTGGIKAIPARCADIRVLGGSTGGTPPSKARSQSIIGDAVPVTPDSIIGDVQPNSIIGDVGVIGRQSIIGDASIIGDTVPAGANSAPLTASRPLSIIGDSASGGSAGSAGSGALASKTAYNDVYGTWRAPAAGKHATAGPNGLRAAGLTLGLGTSPAHPMVQAGSAANRSAAGQVSYYLWWRVVPQQTDQRQISARVHAGDSVYAHIRISHGVATVTLRDLSTGAGGTYLLHLTQLSHA
jgi:Peptidase A4 family